MRGESRSEAIERLLAKRSRLVDDRRVTHAIWAILNRHAADLNEEADDVLTYQADV